uniref:Uncharacterized protein n=1 Tax=Cucumis melo TaxID=3656 RepID=A0A9I9EJT4_CUCME
MSRRGYANLAEDMIFLNLTMVCLMICRKRVLPKNKILDELICGKNLRQKRKGGYINEDVQQVANEIPNDALTQALGPRKYGGRVRGVGVGVDALNLVCYKWFVPNHSCRDIRAGLTQYVYHFGDSSDWGAADTATQEAIHSFSIDRVQKVPLL